MNWPTDPAYQRASRACIAAGRKSDSAKWVGCFWAARVVGRYERGATQALARKMNYSVDTLQNMARAYRMYSECRVAFKGRRKLISNLRKIRQSLPYGVFAATDKRMADSPALEILAELMTAKSEGASARDIPGPDRDYIGGEWNGELDQLRLRLISMIDRVPPAVRPFIRAAADALVDALEKAKVTARASTAQFAHRPTATHSTASARPNAMRNSSCYRRRELLDYSWFIRASAWKSTGITSGIMWPTSNIAKAARTSSRT